MKQYKPRMGSSLTKEQAQKYGIHLNNLIKQKGEVKPSTILEDARNKTSPMHDYFEWDDNVAGEKWRLTQARYIITNIVEVVKINKEERDVRSFFNVVVNNPSSGRDTKYVNLNTVLTNKDYRNELLTKIINHLHNTTQLMELIKSH